MRARKGTRELLRALGPEWSFDRQTHAGHLRLRHVSGVVMYTSASPSDWRARREQLALARRLVSEERTR